MKKEKANKSSNGKWIFLAIVLGLYGLSYFVYPEDFVPIFNSFIKLVKQIAPIFLLVYALMVLINYFINNQTLKKYMGENSGIKGWLIAIVSGILSIGPIYMWYPLMKDLKDSGVQNKFVAAFLYNRGIKLQWLPMLVLYFGWKYSITLLLVMLVFSVFQGMIIDKIVKE